MYTPYKVCRKYRIPTCAFKDIGRVKLNRLNIKTNIQVHQEFQKGEEKKIYKKVSRAKVKCTSPIYSANFTIPKWQVKISKVTCAKHSQIRSCAKCGETFMSDTYEDTPRSWCATEVATTLDLAIASIAVHPRRVTRFWTPQGMIRQELFQISPTMRFTPGV